MNCEICQNELQTIYLEKPLGGVVKDASGKKHWVCNSCQSKHRTKDEQLAQIS